MSLISSLNTVTQFHSNTVSYLRLIATLEALSTLVRSKLDSDARSSERKETQSETYCTCMLTLTAFTDFTSCTVVVVLTVFSIFTVNTGFTVFTVVTVFTVLTVFTVTTGFKMYTGES